MAALPICEVCEKRPQIVYGLCYSCTLDGLRKAKEEADPNLGRYQELSRRASILARLELKAAA